MLSLDGAEDGGGVSLGVDEVVIGVEEEVVVVSAPELLDGKGAGGVDVSLEEVVETDVVSVEGALDEVTTTDSDWVEEVSACGVDEELVVTDSDWVVVVSTV